MRIWTINAEVGEVTEVAPYVPYILYHVHPRRRTTLWVVILVGSSTYGFQ